MQKDPSRLTSRIRNLVIVNIQNYEECSNNMTMKVDVKNELRRTPLEVTYPKFESCKVISIASKPPFSCVIANK